MNKFKAPTLISMLLIFGAFTFAGMVTSTGASFAEWSEHHSVGYFVDIHAKLLTFAGVAIALLCFALLFGLTGAFARIRQLESIIKKLDKSA